jgi:hypothetical protein
MAQSCIRIQAEARNFVFLQNVRTGSGGQPSTYLAVNEVPSEWSSGRAVKQITDLHILCRGYECVELYFLSPTYFHEVYKEFFLSGSIVGLLRLLYSPALS